MNSLYLVHYLDYWVIFKIPQYGCKPLFHFGSEKNEEVTLRTFIPM